jgi:hypothetical protein
MEELENPSAQGSGDSPVTVIRAKCHFLKLIT